MYIPEHSIVCTKFSPFWIRSIFLAGYFSLKKERTLGIKFNSCQMAALPFYELQVSINQPMKTTTWSTPWFWHNLYRIHPQNHEPLFVFGSGISFKALSNKCPKILQMLVSYFLHQLPEFPNLGGPVLACASRSWSFQWILSDLPAAKWESF